LAVPDPNVTAIVLDTDLQLAGLQVKTSADLVRLRDLTRGENGRATVPDGKN